MGMVIDDKDLQPEKMLSERDVKVDGMVTDVSELQPEKALSPMKVIEEDMVTEVRAVHSWKAIRMTSDPDETIKFASAEQLK